MTRPITAAEIGEIRGVNTSGVLSTLLERHLIKIVGRKNVIGRPFLYGTTREFLIRFGLNDLSDLPKVEDMAQALGFEAPGPMTTRTASIPGWSANAMIERRSTGIPPRQAYCLGMLAPNRSPLPAATINATVRIPITLHCG